MLITKLTPEQQKVIKELLDKEIELLRKELTIIKRMQKKINLHIIQLTEIKKGKLPLDYFYHKTKPLNIDSCTVKGER